MRAIYYVVRANGRWKIEAGSMNIGPYSTRAEAVRTAIDAATAGTIPGQQTEVVAETESGNWNTVYPGVPLH